MKKDTRVLDEVTFIGGENPAHPIIRKVVANKKINNPEKIKSFKYRSYNKFYADAEISAEEDDDEFQEFIETKYLFMMESVTERKYLRPDRSKEVVIANRVSGLKNPLFTTLANSFQPFSFYEDHIPILGKMYVNPLTNGTFSRYFFELKDSIYSNGTKVYIIGFEPKRRNFDGLKGLLYINTYQYAVENVIAETANLIGHLTEKKVNKKSSSGKSETEKKIGEEINNELEENKEELAEEVNFSVKIQQKYALVDSIWFPDQLNTDMTIMWDYAEDEGEEKLIGIGRSYLSDIEILPDIRPKEFDRISLEFDPKANRQDSSFWIKYRKIPMDQRGFETYHYIDSVGKEINLDKYVTAFAALTTGQIQIRSISLDIDRFIDFNQFEAVRIGAGFHTNNYFSKVFSVGGYVGYGFKDKGLKYGGDIKLNLTDKNELAVFTEYQNDISESGGTEFYLDKNPLSTELNRRFMLLNFDEYENIEGGIRFYFLKYLDVSASLSKNSKKVTTSYQFIHDFNDPATTQTDFDFSEFKLAVKYSYREKFIEVFGNKVSIGTKYPVIWLNYTKGFNDLLDGEFDYYKLDLKVQKKFVILGWGEPTITVKSGFVSGEIPYTNLYNGNGSKVWEIPFEAASSFQTMELNEFLSDKYIAIYLNYKVGKISINKRRSEPEFSLISNLGFGELDNPLQHINYDFNTMEDGYYESGLLIKNIYKFGIIGFGFGSYYRYGPYSRTNTIDNLAFKLSVGFTL